MALDALRGLIVVLMALDHANYFVAQKHPPGEHWGGAFPTYSDGLTFLTRWVTHPVAPGFMFLMGAGMALFANSRRDKGWSEWQLIRRFWIRGGLLIILQLMIVNRAWQLGPTPFPDVYVGVLFALGAGMMLASLFLRLKAVHLAVLTIALFIGTELLHPHSGDWDAIFDNPAGLLLVYSGGDMELWSNYPVLPWLELVLFGMAFGKWLLRNPDKAYAKGMQLGLVFILGFLVLRSMDGFGNVRPRQGDTVIDFLNVVKYPPAMTFTLITMSINLIVLWIISRVRGIGLHLLRPFVIFGRAPLMFYILHLFLYGLIGTLLTPSGTTIVQMIPYWLLGLLILFPIILLYGSFKQRQSESSILRLF